MRKWHVRFVHRIAPRETDVATIELADQAFSNRNTLGAALRAASCLGKGERLMGLRTEGNKVVAFPAGESPWHSIILTHEG
jgi:hypothetical protein